MKGLKKVALASAVAAISAGAQAELKALDDSAMGELTGQAGLTIDVETQWTIGEFAYEDAGFVVLQDLAMGGNSNETGPYASSFLDNIRMTIDVAGSGALDNQSNQDNLLHKGFSVVRGLAGVHVLASNADTNFGAAYSGLSDSLNYDGSTMAIDDQVTYGDGDLVIHFGFTDAWQKGGGFLAFGTNQGHNLDFSETGLNFATISWADAKEAALHAVDFQFDIGGIGLAASTEAGNIGAIDVEGTDHATGGDTNTSTTMLLSDISFKGYLGPSTLHIENNGNGFSGGALPGSGDADSKIHWDSFVNVTDLDLYIDIAGVQLSDIKINNQRGDLTQVDGVSDSFGFAQSNRTIYAVKDAVLNPASAGAVNSYVDGIALNTQFKGDIEVGALSFGNTGDSIGSLYITDILSTTNWTISAH